MIAVLTEDTLEVIVYSVGITECVTCPVCERTHWQTITSFTREVSGRSVVAEVVVVVSVETELSLKLEVLEDLPLEATIEVIGLTSLTTVSVTNSSDRLNETELRIVAIREVSKVEHRIDHHVLQTRVS